jgi:uncharacterized repeat protein (TIGR03803 family)
MKSIGISIVRLQQTMVAGTLAAASTAAIAQADAYAATITASFSAPTTAPNSIEPSGLQLANDGHLYGTVCSGGSNGTGAVYRVETDGSVTTIHSFAAASTDTSINDDGICPIAGVVQGQDGDLYGTASIGGVNGGGTVFRLTLAGQFSLLHTFGPAPSFGDTNTDGAWPRSHLAVGADGSLYGTTSRGAANNGGTVFKIAPDGTFSTVYSFGPNAAQTGALPTTGVIYASDGNLYGVTQNSADNAAATLYRLTTAGALTVLHIFGNAPGNYETPVSALVEDQNGKLYGAVNISIYSITKSGQYAVLHTQGSNWIGAAAPDGHGYPEWSLAVATNGDLYGSTSDGGPFGSNIGGSTGAGVIFKLTTGGDFSSLYAFGGKYHDPSGLQGVTFGANGDLYGTARFGGTSNQGLVFELPMPPPQNWGSGAAPPVYVGLSPTVVHRYFGAHKSTLSWSSPGAQGCVISSSDGATPTAVGNSGSMSVRPAQLTPGVVDFYVSCTGLRQAASRVPLIIKR